MYILDTNVVSELRKARSGKANPLVVDWSENVSASSLFLSAISVLEIEIGILSVQRRDSIQGSVLRSWMDNQVLPAFHERILPIDTVVSQRCAKLHVPDPRSDRDALIGATALVHGMTVVTRNVSDFEPLGVDIFNPWKR